MKKVSLLSMIIFISLVAFSQGNKKVVFEQGFEDVQFFNSVSPSGLTVKDPANVVWGIFKENKTVSISDEQAATGNQSLKVIRREQVQTNAVAMFGTPLSPKGVNAVETWVYRPSESEFSIVLSGLDQTGNKIKVAYLNTAEKGKFFIRNATATLVRTYMPCPSDSWMLLSVELNFDAKKILFSYQMDGKKVTVGELELVGEEVKLTGIEFGATPCPPGSAIYFDNVKVLSSN